MEGIKDSNNNDIKSLTYIYWEDEPLISVTGIWFVQREDLNFGVEAKIEKLGEIIENVLNALKVVSYDNKEALLDKIRAKQQLLKNLLIKYKEVKAKFIENDKFYRIELFEFYNEKYQEALSSSSPDFKKYISIMNSIQKILFQKFNEFRDEYCDIRNSFFDVNQYIIRIKKMFNFQ